VNQFENGLTSLPNGFARQRPFSNGARAFLRKQKCERHHANGGGGFSPFWAGTTIKVTAARCSQEKAPVPEIRELRIGRDVHALAQQYAFF